MRGILRKIANEELWDMSTLDDPTVVDDIVRKWMARAEEVEAEEAKGKAKEL